MIIIGLTGSICSGKSTISEFLRRQGYVVIDADKLGHESYKNGTDCYKKLVEHFGEGILDADLNIDRKTLGNIVFSSSERMGELKQIVWPEIRKLLMQNIEENRKSQKIIIIEAAVMIEAKWHDLVTSMWVVVASREVILQRLMKRNSLSLEQATSRLSAQITDDERRQYAHVVIDNSDKDVYVLESEVLNIVKNLLK